MDKQSVACSYHGISDTCYNRDETWEYCAKWKKLADPKVMCCMIPFIWNIQNS